MAKQEKLITMRLKQGAKHTVVDEDGAVSVVRGGALVKLTESQAVAFADKFEKPEEPLKAGEVCPRCHQVVGAAGEPKPTDTSGLAQDAGAKTSAEREKLFGGAVPGAKETDRSVISQVDPGLLGQGESPAGSGGGSVADNLGGGSPTDDLGDDPTQGSVEEVRARIAEMDSASALDDLQRREEEGKARKGVLDAIESRRARL